MWRYSVDVLELGDHNMSTTNLVITASFSDFRMQGSETKECQSNDGPEQDVETVISYRKS
jgi:hypothetical protein